MLRGVMAVSPIAMILSFAKVMRLTASMHSWYLYIVLCLRAPLVGMINDAMHVAML